MYYSTPETNPNIQPSAVDFSKVRIGTIFDAIEILDRSAGAEETQDQVLKASEAMFNSSFAPQQPKPLEITPQPLQITRRGTIGNPAISTVDKLTHDAQSFAVDMSYHFADQGSKV